MIKHLLLGFLLLNIFLIHPCEAKNRPLPKPIDPHVFVKSIDINARTITLLHKSTGKSETLKIFKSNDFGDFQVTLDGKDAKIEDIKPGLLVVSTEDADEAGSIRAIELKTTTVKE